MDTAIDQLVHRRASLPQRTALRSTKTQMGALSERRADTSVVRESLGERQSSLEEQISSSRSRSEELRKRLYGGTVTAARELQAMDEEVKHLARHVSELEDRELEVMEELEPLDADLGAIDAELARLSSEAGVLEAEITEREREIDGELETEGRRRAALQENVPSDLLSRYEQLRKKLGGTGAARLVGGSCGGCHLQLPAVELDQLKRADPDAVILCDQCGRILVR